MCCTYKKVTKLQQNSFSLVFPSQQSLWTTEMVFGPDQFQICNSWLLNQISYRSGNLLLRSFFERHLFFLLPCAYSPTLESVFTLLPVSLDSFCLKIAMKKFNPKFHLKSIFDSYRLFLHFQEGTMCKHEVLADYSYLSDSITGLLSSYT